jgi:S-(hydroxymethyl)glutathione synthase
MVAREEACMSVHIHPAVDSGLTPGSGKFAGGTLSCRCTSQPVKVEISSAIAHNHACGCTKCWKPSGATFSIVAVVPSDKVSVTANGDKLAVVDKAALIQRYACTKCGTHMYGPVEKVHAFQNLTFIHPELFTEAGAPPPEFAAFVSSVIEDGVDPGQMAGIRARLRELGLEPYDCLNPPLMDYLATFAAKAKGVRA